MATQAMIKENYYEQAIQAIHKKNHPVLQKLLTDKKVIDNEETLDSSLIGHALRTHNIKALKILLAHGLFNPNKGYWTYPLHLATSIGNVTAAALLLKYGADINKQTFRDGWTPLHFTCERNNNPLIELLVKHGANTTFLNKTNGKPFDLTAESLLKKA
jgi:ankyrin repeat protein